MVAHLNTPRVTGNLQWATATEKTLFSVYHVRQCDITVLVWMEDTVPNVHYYKWSCPQCHITFQSWHSAAFPARLSEAFSVLCWNGPAAKSRFFWHSDVIWTKLLLWHRCLHLIVTSWLLVICANEHLISLFFNIFDLWAFHNYV